MKRGTFEQSADVTILADRFRQMAVGEVIEWEELDELMGRDVRERSWQVSSARRIVERDDGIVIDTIRGVGIKRLDDIGIVGVSDKVRRAIARKVRKASKTLRCVNVGSLDQPAQLRYWSSVATLSALHHCSSESSAKKISLAVEKSGVKEIPLAKTLEAFK